MGSLQIPTFLLVLFYAAVVPTTEKVIHMGMFPEAADYSFYNCSKEMLQMVTKAGGLLETELKNDQDFTTMWKDEATCEKVIPEDTPEHRIALESFVEADPKFHKIFSKKLFQGSSTYRDDFPFKSLFFLLTDVMRLLKSDCFTVYSGAEEEYSTKIGDKVRFESFFQARLKYTDAVEEAAVSKSNGTVFNISSCSAINVDEVCGEVSEDMDVLISPTEVFTVMNIRTVGKSGDQYKEITLKHSHFQSSSNCSGIVSLSEESSSSFLSSSLLILIASFLMTYFNMLTL